MTLEKTRLGTYRILFKTALGEAPQSADVITSDEDWIYYYNKKGFYERISTKENKIGYEIEYIPLNRRRVYGNN